MKKIILTMVLCGLALNGKTIETDGFSGGGSHQQTKYYEETEYVVDETETEIVYAIEHTDEEFDILSRIISAEAGNCSWEMMEGVGSVFLNRVASPKFPNTIAEVAFQPNQYSPTINGTYYNEPTDGAKEVAEYLLCYGSQAPSDVLYQANFPQGTGTWKTLSTSYSTMYFCYG